ncbi:hypothetical protein AUJ40_01215 [Candidatus Berkelbacteria bacterium CG1_02_42_45]|uniref:Uncharacterized protein n=2 Tax=Candidatus Berkelbacteria TaxID=1618330 RepID=A0A1J4RV11_9BACT|nr:MAG: hypothetical protein AUJ40_01215 [Candidatus Berkelbacteria bacterium CG1_02_42_45]
MTMKLSLITKCDGQTFRRGTTLIEVLLYTILVAFFIVLVTSYASNISSGKVKNDATAEVNDNAQIVTLEITSAIRNAKSTVTPENQGETSSVLIVTTAEDQRVTFDLAGGRLRVAKNGGLPIEITSTKVEVSNLVFSNLTRAGTEGNVRVQMQISRVNPTNISEFSATTEIDFAISLRPN